MNATTLEPEPMTKKTAKPPDDRVTLINLKGDAGERKELEAFLTATGLSLSEATRRGLATLMVKRGHKPPKGWKPE